MRKWYPRARVGAAVLALAIPATLAGQVPPAQRQPDTYTVGQALPPVDSGKTLLPITLEQAVARALEHNLDIQSARLDPEIQGLALDVARGAFTPTLSTTYGYNSATTQSTSQLDGGARISNERQTFNGSIQQQLPWLGGRLTTNFNNSRTETDNAFTTRNPSYNSTFSFNYTQPLLAGLKIDNQRAAVETSRLQVEITDLQVQAQIANITHDVRQAYWALRSAIEQIEIQQRSLAQARLLLVQDSARVRAGRMVELDLLQAEAQVASAEQSLLNAEIQWRNQEFALKRLLLAGTDDPLLAQTLNPTDQPAPIAQEVDLQGAVQTALRERADIRQQRQQREITEVNLDVTKSNALPDLNLTAGYSLQGVGGDLYDRSGLGGEPVLVAPGGYNDALLALRDRDAPTWNVQLQASYPIGRNVDRANLERARLQLRQVDLALKNQELNIVTQVTTAGLAVRNTYLQVEAARRNREASERNAEAERLRHDLGVSTSFQMLTAQNSMTSARLAELQAIINHMNAIAEFDRVQRIGN